MRRYSILMAVAILAGAPMQLAPASAQAAAAPGAAHYSVTSTLVGKLLDDPAAVAVLKKMIPTVYANEMFQASARELTLKDVQQYEPDALSDANLAKLQAEFDKLPIKS